MAADSKKDTPTVDLNPFRDLTKTLEQFKVPGVDMSAFVAARRKDVDALTAANKAAYEALQDLGRTQTEMLTHAMKGMQEAAEGAVREGLKGAAPTKQAEAARVAWEKMLADIKELAELARKSQAQAMAGLAETATESTKVIKNPGVHQVGIRRMASPAPEPLPTMRWARADRRRVSTPGPGASVAASASNRPRYVR